MGTCEDDVTIGIITTRVVTIARDTVVNTAPIVAVIFIGITHAWDRKINICPE